jgi:hypothetical protein
MQLAEERLLCNPTSPFSVRRKRTKLEYKTKRDSNENRLNP